MFVRLKRMRRNECATCLANEEKEAKCEVGEEKELDFYPYKVG
jgi:hypothetical protein